MSSADNKIQAFVICWEGFEDKAAAIATEISPLIDAVTVIYSNSRGLQYDGPGRWLTVSNAWLYGKKFVECQKFFDGDIHLQIQADAYSDDWPQVIHNCRKAFSEMPRLGVWAPDVDYSPKITKYVSIRGIGGSSMVEVLQTDGVIWAFSADIDRELRMFDIGANNSGWGIEQLAACIAFRFGKQVIRDTSILVKHPESTGYPKKMAMFDKVQLTEQFGHIDKVTYRVMVYAGKWREQILASENCPSLIALLADWGLRLVCRTWISVLKVMPSG